MSRIHDEFKGRFLFRESQIQRETRLVSLFTVDFNHSSLRRINLKSISLRELFAVRMILERQEMAMRLRTPDRKETEEVLLHIDNQAVSRVLMNMTCRNPEMMGKLRLLHATLLRLNIKISANWLPSELNCHADCKSLECQTGPLFLQ